MKAAIWWRVSTDTQTEISPDTQQREGLTMAQEEGYDVPAEYIIGTDWHSLSVWDSPAMNELKDLIRSHAIGAVFMYDADRGPSKPAHRLLFRALCEEYGVLIRCKHGQVPDGDMGEVMEFLSAWSKEKQVQRAQQGARDGLRDRARVKGLPVNGRMPYGYQLRYDILEGKKVPVAWDPNPNTHPIASRIWRMALEGVSLRQICRVLTEEGIPSPTGRPNWTSATLYGLLRNPIYRGEYCALRREAVTPKQRRGDTYGHTSHTAIPEDQWIQLDFPVVNPVVTPVEWLLVQDRMRKNKLDSQLHVHGFYLLSGMIFCAHDGRRWRGDRAKGKQGRYYYRCTLSPGNSDINGHCPIPKINGPRMDGLVWDSVVAFLNDPETYLAEMARLQGRNTRTIDDVQSTMQRLNGKLDKVYEMETQLALNNSRGDLSDEAYRRATAMMRAEASHYRDELERQQAELATLERSREALDTLGELRERIRDKLVTATPETRRWVLQSLDARIIVNHDGIESISIGSGPEGTSVKHTGLRR